jgi:hypothetical protein
MGEERTIYNRNCANAYEDLKLRQKNKSTIKQSNQTQKPQCRRQSKFTILEYLPTASAICGPKIEPPNRSHTDIHEEPIRSY